MGRAWADPDATSGRATRLNPDSPLPDDPAPDESAGCCFHAARLPLGRIIAEKAPIPREMQPGEGPRCTDKRPGATYC
jgi:hypothetical protein